MNIMVVHCVAVDLSCGRLCFSGLAANSAAVGLHGGGVAAKSIASCFNSTDDMLGLMRKA